MVGGIILEGGKDGLKATICGIDCRGCGWKESCRGCRETNGRPFGGRCVAAECFNAGGERNFTAYKNRMIEEFNALGIDDMPLVTELFQLNGGYVNLEYVLPNGERVRLLDDSNIYLGCQLEKCDSDRCYGLVGDHSFLLVCEYGCNGAKPEIVVYKRR